MKRSYRKNILRSIKISMGRFLSVFAITALGVGFLAGLLSTTPDMKYTVDQYYDENRLYDIFMKSTMGFSEADVEAVQADEHISKADGYYVSDVLSLDEDGNSHSLRLQSTDFDSMQEEDSDVFCNLTLTEGRFPENDNECVVEFTKPIYSGLKPGDTLTLVSDDDDLDDTYAVTEYTITGLVDSPEYFSLEDETTTIGNGKINCLVYVREGAFNLDCYTEIKASVAGACEKNCFADDYDDLVDEAVDSLEELAGDREVIRRQEIVDEATAELDQEKDTYGKEKKSTLEKLADAAKQLTEGEDEIAAGENKLAAARAELADGKSKYKTEKAAAGKQILAAKKKLSSGEKQLESGKKELASGKKDLAAGKKKLASGKKELAEAKKELESGKQQLNEGKTQLEEAKQQLESGRTELDAKKESLTLAKAQLDASAEDIEKARQAVASGMLDEETSAAYTAQIEVYDNSKKQYEDGMTAVRMAEQELTAGEKELQAKEQELKKNEEELASGEKEIEANEKEIKKSEKKIASNEKKIAAAEKKLKASEKKLASGEKELKAAEEKAKVSLAAAEKKLAEAENQIASGELELAEARKSLAEARKTYETNKKKAEDGFVEAEQELADAETKIDEIDDVTWYILDRHSNVGYMSFYGNADKVASIAKVFPVFFFLIAALVVLTTMTRMVEEERTEIGVIKALGYSNGAIASKYLIYAAVAAVLGSAAGLAVGIHLFPLVIWNAYSIMYTFPDLICLADPQICLGSSGLLLFSVLGATLYACMGALREKPAYLMLPKAPKPGKRVFLEYIGPLWSHMKFTYKLTARNLLRYKKRFFMTILGVAGCTALLLTGFGLRDSIGDIVKIQYETLQKYDLEIKTDEEVDVNGDSVLAHYLKDTTQNDGYITLHKSGAEVTVGDETGDVTLVVPKDSGEMESFRTLRERKSKEEIPFDGNSVILTEKIAESLGVSVGDTLTIENADGEKADFTLTGITENYLYSYVFVGTDAYREAYKAEPEYLYVNIKSHAENTEEEDELSRELLEDDTITGIQFSTDVSTSFSDMLGKIDYIVIVLIISAGLLAFIVLYDLTNINISERQKEIATIKVLGFYDHEVSAYIYRETVILSILGTLFGLVLGIFLHAFVIRTAEMDAFMFGRDIYPKSFLLAAVITMIFSALVNVVMGRKMRHIDMAESMKAVD